jgi:hypothetical protein
MTDVRLNPDINAYISEHADDSETLLIANALLEFKKAPLSYEEVDIDGQPTRMVVAGEWQLFCYELSADHYRVVGAHKGQP